jgi:alpha-1,2-mannosyltransferase
VWRSVQERAIGGRWNALAIACYGLLPAALFMSILLLAIGHRYAFDLQQFWQGAHDVVHGRSPYPSAASLPSAEEATTLSPTEIQDRLGFPYPAAVAVGLAPLGALPFWAAAVIFTFVLCGAFVLALWLLGVRDWRCYGVAFGSIAVIGAVRLGTFTPLLVLALAVAWRFRHGKWRPAAAVAAAIVAKLFLWPVVAWLIATRRLSTAVASVTLAIGAVVVGWSVIAFAGLHDYPHLLNLYARAGEAKGYSGPALGMALGLSPSAARVVGFALGAAMLVAVFVVARGRDGDRRAFVASIAASLLLTPIVWLHYFALLFVPIAVTRRGFGWLWLAPLALWATPFQESHGDVWRLAAVLGCGALVVSASLRTRGKTLRAERNLPAVARGAEA